MTMNSHNPKSLPLVKNESVHIETDYKGVRVVRSKIIDANDLSIADDFDNGGDPYNCTGQHVVIKLKDEPQD